MKTAVIETGGKQYLVKPGQTLEVELLGQDKKVSFEPLLVFDDKSIKVGTPTVKDAKVNAEVVEQVKGQKVKVLKFKAKKRVKKLTGHRQRYTLIKVTTIS